MCNLLWPRYKVKSNSDLSNYRSNLDILPEIRYTMDTTFNAILTVRKSEDTFRSLVRSKNIRSDELHGRASISVESLVSSIY